MSAPAAASGYLPLRRLILLGAAGSIVLAVLGGLARMGWGIPHMALPSGNHGGVLVTGVFVGVISLERAVALNRLPAYLTPLLAVLGGVAQLAGLLVPGQVLAAASAVGLVGINVAIVKKQSETFTWLMLLGSGALAFGNFAWALGQPIFLVVPSWITFFVVTIVAERVEMGRLVKTPRAATFAIAVLSLALTVASAAFVVEPAAIRVAGVALAAVGLWSLKFDLARRTVKTKGLPRFAASGVLAAWVWVTVAGLLFAFFAFAPAGPQYDMPLHAVFLGFVLAMVFSHAPLIFPAVARVTLPYGPALYAPVLLLHGSLALRLVADWAGMPTLRQVGGLLNALSILGFALTLFVLRLRAVKPKAPPSVRPALRSTGA